MCQSLTVESRTYALTLHPESEVGQICQLMRPLVVLDELNGVSELLSNVC